MTTSAPTLRTAAAEVHLGPGGFPGLLSALDPTAVWIRDGQGMIGLGEATGATSSGASRFETLAHWWDHLPETDHRVTGFVSAAFADASSFASRLVVPELLICHSPGRTTVIAAQADHAGHSAESAPEISELLARHGLMCDADGFLSPVGPAAALPQAALSGGAQSVRQYLDSVAAGLSAIDEKTVQKLVLARDVVVSAQHRIPHGPLLARLMEGYPQTWTYCVDNLVGATPEMLVSMRGNQLSSRVLAGTVDHDVDPHRAAEALLHDAKQYHEHALAVTSLVDQLAPVTETLQAPAEPNVLELPNVYHLATDITGTLTRDVRGRLPNPLQVAAAAHPTAAVCGTPTPEAGKLLAQLEGLDRGPYAGPVGWLDTEGNADFGIALRGGVHEGDRLRLYAGCGVVAGSEPEAELAETWSKLRPMLWALGLSDALPEDSASWPDGIRIGA